MARWNERKRDIASIEGDQTERMDARMARLEAWCESLQSAHETCLQNLAAERDARAVEHAARLEAEAMLMARQRSDESTQIRLSAERQVDAAGRTETRARDRAAGAADERALKAKRRRKGAE